MKLSSLSGDSPSYSEFASYWESHNGVVAQFLGHLDPELKAQASVLHSGSFLGTVFLLI